MGLSAPHTKWHFFVLKDKSCKVKNRGGDHFLSVFSNYSTSTHKCDHPLNQVSFRRPCSTSGCLSFYQACFFSLNGKPKCIDIARLFFITHKCDHPLNLNQVSFRKPCCTPGCLSFYKAYFFSVNGNLNISM